MVKINSHSNSEGVFNSLAYILRKETHSPLRSLAADLKQRVSQADTKADDAQDFLSHVANLAINLRGYALLIGMHDVAELLDEVHSLAITKLSNRRS